MARRWTSRRRLGRSRSRAIAGGVAVLLGGVALLLGGLSAPRAAGQTGTVNFSATADAFGSRLEITVSQAPLFPNLVDGGGPTAQVRLDSLGSVRSIAAHPWPGEVVVGLPGLAAGLGPQLPGLVGNLPNLLGGLLPVPLPDEVVDLLAEIDLPADELAPLFDNAPPLPPYPFVATADGFDRPQDRVDLGVGELAATAERDAATARAVLEPGGGGVGAATAAANSFARVDEDGSVAVEAAGSIRGLQVGPLQIGVISSLARMGMDSSGAVTQESEFTVSAIQLGSVSLDITAEGLEIAGTNVPIPIAEVVNQILASSGIEMRLLEERITDTGVVTSGLQISYPVDFAELPFDELSGLGHGEITVTLGQSIVTLTGAPIPPVPDVDLGEVPPVTAGGPVAPPPTGSLDLAAEEAAMPSAPSGESAAPEGSPQGLVRSRGPLAEDFDAMPLYLVVAGSVLVVAGAGQLLRVAAFRPRTADAW